MFMCMHELVDPASTAAAEYLKICLRELIDFHSIDTTRWKRESDR